jgi:superfamily II DNA helicase RecQ
VRGQIDRTDITYVRYPLQRLEGETLVALGVRAFMTVRDAAPRWVRGSRTIIFTALTDTAIKLARVLCGHGMSAWAYVGRNMSKAQREQSRRAWQADPKGVMVCTSAFGTGTSTPGVGLVIAFEFASDVIELVQLLGRPAGEDSETGFAVLCATAQFASERLSLLAPTPTGRVAAESFVRCLSVVSTPFCLRAALLLEFGHSAHSCAGCDHCCVRGSCVSPSCGGDLAERSHVEDGRTAGVYLLATLSATPVPFSGVPRPPSTIRCATSCFA